MRIVKAVDKASMSKIFLFWVWFFWNLFGTGTLLFAENNETVEFQKRLIPALTTAKEYLNTAMADEEDVLRFQTAVNQLNAFGKEFPQSKFADDAQIISLCFFFLDAVSSGEKERIPGFLADAEKITREYPQGSLEEITLSKCERALNQPGAAVFFTIPYPAIKKYMAGWAARECEDYEGAVTYYSELKDTLNYEKDTAGYMAEDVYITLADAYIKLGKKKEAGVIAQEALKKFPDHRGLRKHMRQVLIHIATETKGENYGY